MQRFLSLFLIAAIALRAQDLPQEFSQTAEEVTALTFPMIPERIEIPPLPVVHSYKSPLLATTLSVVPGLGHLYLGKPKEALGLAGSFATGFGMVIPAVRSHLSREPRLISGLAGFMTMETSLCYGIYAVYRDARLHNSNIDYSYKMPTDTFSELSAAPFSFSVLKKREVWGGLLGCLTIATGVSYLSSKVGSHIELSVSPYELFNPIRAFPVGISEESLFRGYLQSQLSEITNPWTGIALSSLAFGAAHISNARYMSAIDRKNYYRFSIPFITLSGAYFGWVTYKNQSLREAVALHSWYDFILFALNAAASTSITKEGSFEWAGNF